MKGGRQAEKRKGDLGSVREMGWIGVRGGGGGAGRVARNIKGGHGIVRVGTRPGEEGGQ